MVVVLYSLHCCIDVKIKTPKKKKKIWHPRALAQWWSNERSIILHVMSSSNNIHYSVLSCPMHCTHLHAWARGVRTTLILFFIHEKKKQKEKEMKRKMVGAMHNSLTLIFLVSFHFGRIEKWWTKGKIIPSIFLFPLNFSTKQRNCFSFHLLLSCPPNQT